MRVSTAGAYLNGVSALQRLQSSLDHTQRQISSGRRLLTPSDDPIAASRSLEMQESLGRLEQFDRNADVARNRLSQEETALVSVNNVLQRVRELALQANNATQSNESRGLIAIEIREQLEYLVQSANQKNGSGGYLFSGNLDETAPVSVSGANYSYNGDQGQRFIQIGEGRQVADGDPGSDIFFKIRAGNGDFKSTSLAANTGTGVLGQGSVTDPTSWDQDTYRVRFIDPANYEVLNSGGAVVTTGAYQSGEQIGFQGIQVSITGAPATGDEFLVEPSPYEDIFSTIDRLATALENPGVGDSGQAALTNDINAGLMGIDQAIGVALNVRTQIGSRLGVIENQLNNNSATTLAIQGTLSSILDLDYAEAISLLSLEVNTLEAAQRSFALTQQLSLFNYF